MRIKADGRFIENDQVGLMHDGIGEADALSR